MQNIEDFRKNSINLFVDEILPLLKPFEEERLQVRKECIKNFVIFFVLLFISIIVLTGLYIVKVPDEYVPALHIWFSIDGFALLWFLSYPFFISKQFENSVKKKIMPVIFSKFLFFKWQDSSTFDADKKMTLRKKIESFKLFGHFEEIKYDDVFTGNYKNVKTSIYEVNTGEWINRRMVLIFLDLDYSISKTPVLVKKRGMSMFFKKLNVTTADLLKMQIYKENHLSFPDMKRVILEDVDFEKKFDVYSADQIEARCLFSAGFVDRFNKLADAFNSSDIEASFVDNKILLSLYVNKDMFKMANVFVPVFSFREYKTMIDEFSAVLGIIDELKLNK